MMLSVVYHKGKKHIYNAINVRRTSAKIIENRKIIEIAGKHISVTFHEGNILKKDRTCLDPGKGDRRTPNPDPKISAMKCLSMFHTHGQDSTCVTVGDKENQS